MFKLIKLLTLFLLITFCLDANAQGLNPVKERSNKITVTGFKDYPPLGSVDNNVFDSIFMPMIKKMADESKQKIVYFMEGDYPTLVIQTRRGKADVILGIYNETELYTGIEYVYPAIVSNPVKLIMLPHRSNEVKSMDDLKKLKGGINSNEIFSDFVAKQIKTFNPISAGSSYELYEKLFRGEIDYIFSGYYYSVFETIRLGIRNHVNFAKQNIWEMPLFLGVSKVSSKRKNIMKYLEKVSKEADARDKINAELTKRIQAAEEKYKGVVPPSFTSNKD